jgi:dienelactone hydrolase
MRTRLILATMALGLLAAPLMGQAPAAPQDLAAAFGAREGIREVRLSPDGSKLAYIVPTTGKGSAVLTVAPGPDAKPAVALVVSGDPDRLTNCDWVANNRLICTLWGVVSTPDGVLPYSRKVAIDANGANPKMLSRQNNMNTRGYNLRGGEVIDLLPEEDGMVLMTRLQLPDDRLGTRFGSSQSGMVVEKVNTRTLAVSKVESVRDGLYEYLSDRRGTLRIMGIKQTDRDRDTGVIRYFYRAVGGRDWLQLGDYAYQSDKGFLPVAVDHERNAVYGFRKLNGRQAVYLKALDGTGKEELVFARPDVDVDDLVYIGRRQRVVGATFATDVRQISYFDPDFAKLSTSLAKALPNQPLVSILDSSLDEKKLLIRAGSDSDPGVYYVLDRTSKQMATFQPVRPLLEGVKLAEMKPVTYTATDGTTVPAYLTLPPSGAAKGLPAIVMPHGGPGARDEWGFDWLAQYYAVRGYAVIQPNFRGSAGYGDAWFEENGFQSWKLAIGDVTDAGHWLVKQGIADPSKLAIVGWSYGGYAALQSAVTEPGLFKAVVAVAPVTDLAALKQDSRWWSNYNLVSDFIGTGPHVREGSPAQNAVRIKAPVLMFHGTLDRNVDIEQARIMDSKLQAVGVPHQLVVFDGLDHYLEDSAARARLLRDSDAFLRKSMGM